MVTATNLGRGEIATADMKARIAALRACGADVFDALWERHHRAVTLHEGFRYEHAPVRVTPDPTTASDVEGTEAISRTE